MFVSVSLMEVALVTYLSGGDPSIPRNRDVETMTTITMETMENGTANEKDKTDTKGRRKRYIHRVSRIVFPVAFCTFNVVYWMYYI